MTGTWKKKRRPTLNVTFYSLKIDKHDFRDWALCLEHLQLALRMMWPPDSEWYLKVAQVSLSFCSVVNFTLRAKPCISPSLDLQDCRAVEHGAICGPPNFASCDLLALLYSAASISSTWLMSIPGNLGSFFVTSQLEPILFYQQVMNHQPVSKCAMRNLVKYLQFTWDTMRFVLFLAEMRISEPMIHNNSLKVCS